MPEETPRRCETCKKGEERTGKPCPTRSGCFTPLYLNWAPIVEEDKQNSKWSITTFNYDKETDHLTIHLDNATGGSRWAELSPNEIVAYIDALHK